MRANRAAALALLSGILTACGQPGAMPGGTGTSPDQDSSSPSEVALGDVRMSAGHSIEAGTLVVEYELRNIGTAPVLVHDRVPPTLGSATLPDTIDPERTWVFMSGGRIRLSKQGFGPAPGVRFIAAPVMGARVLAPGQALSGRARVGLPPELDVPGPEFDAPRTPVDATAAEIEFCVQVTRGSEGQPSGADPAVLQVPSTAPGPDELICSGPLDATPIGAPGSAPIGAPGGQNPSGTPSAH